MPAPGQGELVFSGTIEGAATGQTSALVFASCADVAASPPGTYPDVFTSQLVFEGTVDGEPARADVLYIGRVRPGGEIDARLVLSDGVWGVLEVFDARVAVGGGYRGTVIVGGALRLGTLAEATCLSLCSRQSARALRTGLSRASWPSGLVRSWVPSRYCTSHLLRCMPESCVATAVLLCGALLFSSLNLWLARAAAQDRKQCGEDLPQAIEGDEPGSGKAIAIGTTIDALPEGLILGRDVAHSAASTIPVVAGFFLANVPESLSSSAGMHLAGRSMRYIFSVWVAASVVTPVAAVLGSVFFAAASPTMAGILDALSGGILLAMAVETMIPEAFDKAPLFSGTVAVLGFATIAAVAALASVLR